MPTGIIVHEGYTRFINTSEFAGLNNGDQYTMTRYLVTILQLCELDAANPDQKVIEKGAKILEENEALSVQYYLLIKQAKSL